jgi:hypothetical protein
MIASIRSSATSSSHEATPARTAKIAELNKRVGSLQQELKVAQEMKPAELAGLRSNSISQDIVAATSQIEKIVLASQLARLSLQSERQAGKSDGLTDTETTREGDPSTAAKEAADAKAEERSGATSKDKRAEQDERTPAGQALEEAVKTAHERLSPEHGAAAHAAHASHRTGAAAAAGVISSTYRADGEKVRQINLQA